MESRGSSSRQVAVSSSSGQPPSQDSGSQYSSKSNAVAVVVKKHWFWPMGDSFSAVLSAILPGLAVCHPFTAAERCGSVAVRPIVAFSYWSALQWRWRQSKSGCRCCSPRCICCIHCLQGMCTRSLLTVIALPFFNSSDVPAPSQTVPLLTLDGQCTNRTRDAIVTIRITLFSVAKGISLSSI